MDANLPIDAEAVRLRADATPTLLRMLRAKDSVLTIKLMALVRKQKVVKFDYFPASLQNSQAAWAFAALDGMDNSAVPKLVGIAEHLPLLPRLRHPRDRGLQRPKRIARSHLHNSLAESGHGWPDLRADSTCGH